MSFIDDYRQEISPEFALLMMPEFKEDYIKDNPCKWRKGKIALWEVACARIDECDPLIEKYSILCALVFFSKKGKHRYFTPSKKTVQEQIAVFDQQVGAIHELTCPITDKYGNTDVKVRLFQSYSEVYHDADRRFLTKTFLNNLL
jgi:hypothetical protein